MEGDTKTRIGAAALSLFVNKGIAETSTRDLAQAAGIAEGTIYRHYSSKDELVRTLFTTNYAGLARHLDDVQRRHTGCRDKLAAMIAALCRFYDENPVLFRFLLMAQHQVLPHFFEADNPVEVLHRILAEAIKAGEIALADPELGAALVMGMVIQPATFLVYGRLRPPFAAHSRQIADACWRALTR